MRPRSLHVGLALLILIVLAGGLYFVNEDRPKDGGRVGREPPIEVEAPTLSGRTKGQQTPLETGIDAASAREAAENAYFLRTRLRGMRAKDAGAIEVVVRRSYAGELRRLPAERHGPGITARSVADASGAALVPMDALLRLPHQVGELGLVEVSVDHPAYLPARRRIRLAPDPNGAPRGTTWEADLPLTRAGAVTGHVVCETSVAAIQVRLYPLRTRRPVHPPVDVCGTDEAGAFRLRFGADGDYAVIAWEEEHRDGSGRTLLPAGRIVRLRTGERAAVEPLVLETGVVLAGVLRHGGVGVDGGQLDFRFAGAATRLTWWKRGRDYATAPIVPSAILWADDRPIPAPRSAPTKADGTWRLENVAPGAYGITLGHLPRFDPHPQLEEDFGWRARAPDDDIVLDVEGAELSVRVRSRGHPVADAWIEVDAGGNAAGHRTGEDGTFEILLAWDTEYAVRVEARDHEPAALTIHPSPSTWEREHVVTLTPRPTRPSLLVTVVKPDGAPIRDVGLGLLRPGDDARRPWRTQDHDGGKGRYRLAELEAGRYRLVVRPGGHWWYGSGMYLASEREVLIPGEGETRIHVTAQLGGALRVEAWDEAGEYLAARCTLRTLAGDPVLTNFCCKSPNGRSASVNRLSTRGPSHTHPGLPAGTYRVELTEKGYAAQSHVVEIREGKVTPLVVTMRSD